MPEDSRPANAPKQARKARPFCLVWSEKLRSLRSYFPALFAYIFLILGPYIPLFYNFVLSIALSGVDSYRRRVYYMGVGVR